PGRSPKVTARWAKSHIGIEGNEAVDEEAKKAAQGGSSPWRHLPAFLHHNHPLPHSISSLKQNHNADLKAKWAERWQKSERHARIAVYEPRFPFTKF
ncbi:hypothetical protein BD626DRAFT_352158, partial [Schizophyllum amplum]